LNLQLMDSHGPRIMVNVGTQAASNTGLNPRDLAPLTNDAFLATFMGKTALSASNGISRQHNNYRQSYTTQMERVTIRSKPRPLAGNHDTGLTGPHNGAGLDSDTAILSIIRGGGSDSNQLPQRQLQGNRNRRRSLNQQQPHGGYADMPCSPNYRPANWNGVGDSRRRRTRSGGQQISVVDQMAAQPHIPYAILPKRFEPKQAQGNGGQQQPRPFNNNAGRRRGGRRAPRQQHEYFEDDLWEDEEDNEDRWLERMPQMMRRRLNLQGGRRSGRDLVGGGYYGPRLMHMEDLYDPYSYGPMTRPPPPLRPRRRMGYPEDGFVPFDIVPAYDLNEWQGPYARPRSAMYVQQQRGGFRGFNRNDGVFLRDDHRANASTRQSRNGNQQQRSANKSTTPTRNGKQFKSPKNNKASTVNSAALQKRRNSRQRKSRNQNSKSEGSSESKSATDETTKDTTIDDKKMTDEDKRRQELLNATTGESPLPPRDTTDERKDTTDDTH